ncbi:helix-turn-helix domain-containing protein [Actinoplanes flavus]|uniref:Helix-turn-helix transcriptional regulator n=1 Tax=Actinoplanes flavus TaxID=2820290 RepID=A0ABS3V063_9ACTN|nr:helix-turn-helix transcriptional regulator [Actinoplanes flavus]MBO3744220.1 helix-turn-helix transcriptional regulator [Actinoplanes flavus]
MPNDALTQERTAWLLASHRRCAGFTVTRFADHTGASRGRVHAWEKGDRKPTIAVVRRYESICGRDLLPALDVAHRAATGAIGGPVIRRPTVTAAERRERTFALVEQADGGPMSGADWDDLTCLVSTDPHPCLRERDVRMLTGRLTAELCAAEGDGWARRQEALARLIGHPALGPIAIDLCDQLARDREFTPGGDVLLGLDGSRHPDAAAVVSRHLRDPVSPEVEAGARLVAEQKRRLGHLPGRTPSPRRPGRPPGPERIAFAEALAHAAACDVGLPAGAATGLVIAMLYDPDATARYVAIRLLAASPLRAPLAHRIDQRLAAREPVDGVRLLSALASLSDDRRTAERLACALDVPAPIRDAAVRSLGHMPGDSPPALWRHLMAPRTGESALVYALGMRRRRALLQEVVDDPARSPATRAAARWWLRYLPDGGPLDK